MSLLFIVGFLSLLLLPLTCLAILCSLQFQQQKTFPTLTNNNTTTTHFFDSYLTLSNFSSVWKLLLRHTLFPNSPKAKAPAAGVRLHDGGGEAEECVVCLCRFQQGDEIRELACRHVFHMSCLDAWVGRGRATCPLCRGRVNFPAVDEDGAEMLFFRFCSFVSSSRHRDQDNWWLR